MDQKPFSHWLPGKKGEKGKKKNGLRESANIDRVWRVWYNF